MIFQFLCHYVLLDYLNQLPNIDEGEWYKDIEIENIVRILENLDNENDKDRKMVDIWAMLEFCSGDNQPFPPYVKKLYTTSPKSVKDIYKKNVY